MTGMRGDGRQQDIFVDIIVYFVSMTV